MSKEQKLSSVFNHTRNSYKYYWWLAILKILKKDNSQKIPFDHISIEMLLMVWYPINFYKISLGSQDKLGKYIKEIKTYYKLPDEILSKDLEKFLYEKRNDQMLSPILGSLGRYVPYRFIRPWFPELVGVDDPLVNKSILKLQLTKNDVPYFIDSEKEQITISREWNNWISNNIKIIESFTLFELFIYIEKKNPNTINISTKLFKPIDRGSLNLSTKLWKEFAIYSSNTRSVFENTLINDLSQLSIDHFLPWSYVTHNQLWNLHPMEKNNNSSKGNRLPSKKYITDYSQLQCDFLHFVSKKEDKYIHDYCDLLSLGIEDIKSASKEKITRALLHELETKFIKATNMGYDTNWVLA